MSRRIDAKLMHQLGKASAEYRLIEPNDRVMVCLSGGKDSYVLLHLLQQVQAKAPFKLDLIAVNLDQGHPGFPQHVIAAHCESVGVPYKMLSVDTYSIVQEKIEPGKTQCSLCSRLRRGVRYRAARELACTKIALGHHEDDAIERPFLNLIFSDQLKAMPPRLRSDDVQNVVIRPLSTSGEADIALHAESLDVPIIPCDVFGSQDGFQRQQVKQLIAELTARNSAISVNLFAPMSRVRPTHLLDQALRAQQGPGEVCAEDAFLGSLR